MTIPSFAVRDSATMLRRDVLHSLRFPLMTISGMTVPIFFLLLFVGVFGDTLHAGLGAIAVGGHYVDYLAPGVILMTASSSAQATAVNICTDMNGSTTSLPAFPPAMPITRARLETSRR